MAHLESERRLQVSLVLSRKVSCDQLKVILLSELIDFVKITIFIFGEGKKLKISGSRRDVFVVMEIARATNHNGFWWFSI